MESISQNWLWILVALGAVAFFFFRGARGHGGFGHAGHGHSGQEYGGNGDRDRVATPSPHVPEAVIDPVSGAPVRTADAPTSVYQGRVYFFASKESRDRFEASPQEYAAKAPGVMMDRSAASERPRRRRGGC